MNSKKKKDIVLEIRAYIIFGLILIVFFGMGFLVYFLQEEYEINDYMIALNIAILIISPLYYFLHNFREKLIKSRTEKKTIIKDGDFTYYCDIINEYSPATIGFILDGTYFRRDLIASCMYLLDKGYLVKNEEEIIKKTDKDCSSLSTDLQFIVNNVDEILKSFDSKKIEIEGNNSKIVHSKSMILSRKWYDLISETALKNELVTERKNPKITSFLIVLCLLESVWFGFLENPYFFLLSIGTAFLLIMLKGLAFENNKWIKTQKGYDIYTKIVGLRNYIKDFSLLSEAELKEVAIWDEYLVYAIIFNNHSGLAKDTDKFYKEISSKLKEKYGSTFEI